MLLVNSILHEEIRIRSSKFVSEVEDAYKSILQLSLKVILQLQQTYEEQKPYGDENYMWYPRLIRAYDDSWSPYKDSARYTSPIAKYLHCYSQHTRSESSRTKYKHSVASIEEANRPKHQILETNIKTVRSLVNLVVAKANGDNNIEMPLLSDVAKNDVFQETLFGTVFSEEFRNILLVENPDKKQTQFQELARVLFFAKFVLDRMAVTVVTAKNENYAFDMFEALNTTGEPLTAFETFKPRVINAEGLTNYKESETRNFIKRIENYLDAFNDAQQKQNATTALLVPFALSETGTKLSKRLSDQRRYLRDEFEGLDKTEQQNFVRRLSHSSQFIKDIWPNSKSQESILNDIAGHPELDIASMCIDVLRQANHNITIAPLSCFYSRLRTSVAEERDKATDDFVVAIKAVTAFFVFWRASRRGTDGIDAHYRDLMKTGIKDLEINPFAHSASSDADKKKPTAHQLQLALQHILRKEGNIATKNDWLKSLKNIPLYSISVPLTRFMLLAASHDSRPFREKDKYGLVEITRDNVLDMLNMKQWKKAVSMTVEHIAPQTPDPSWPDTLYTDPEIIHKFGNLALLPQIENSSIGNKPWEDKKLFFRVLSAETIDDIQALLEASGKASSTFGASTEQILKDSQYLPHVKAISLVDEWNEELVNKRTENLGENVWKQLSPWLGY